MEAINLKPLKTITADGMWQTVAVSLQAQYKFIFLNKQQNIYYRCSVSSQKPFCYQPLTPVSVST